MRIKKPFKGRDKIGFVTATFMVLIMLAPFCAAGVAGYYFLKDTDKPLLTLSPKTKSASLKTEFSLAAEDETSGIRTATVTAVQGLRKYDVVKKKYDPPQAHVEESFSLEKAELRGGEFELHVTVSDGSFYSFGSGNTTSIVRRLALDATPPAIKALTPAHYMRQGGAGLVAYTVNKDVPKSGVVAGDFFFPGFKQPSGHYLCLFGFPLGVTADDYKPRLIAVDDAGNEKMAFFVNMAIKRKFGEQRIELPDAFMAERLPELAGPLPSGADPATIFPMVLEKLRKADEAALKDLGSRTAPTPLWDGPFIYLPGSAVTASFGADRSYVYKGQIVGREVHEGIDLASTPRAPVPAANGGNVVHAGDLGRYGKAVVIDHGVGLQTLYGHLSEIGVAAGQTVTKGQPVGRTGRSGLAVSDHLHFGVVLSGVPIIPIEWWDARWLDDNVTQKRKRFVDNPVGQ